MDVHTQVSRAISEFDAWQQPGEFRRRILLSPHLDAHGQEAFDSLWRRAVDSPHWRDPVALAVAAQSVRRALQVAEPLLTAAAIDGLVRAASYEWR